VTSRRRASFSARNLALALVVARAIEVEKAATTSEHAVTGGPAARAAHPLGRQRRRGGRERTAALSTSAAAHPRSVRRPGARNRAPWWITILPLARRRSCGDVDHKSAGEWISIRAPLKDGPVR
jgi:hypothetical protein